MKRDNDLHLHEELTLLALRDEAGTHAAGGMFHMTLGGALLAELLLGGRVEVQPGRMKRQLLGLLRREPFGDPLLNEALGKVRDAGRRADLKSWVRRFGNLSHIKHRSARQLVRRSILRRDEDKVLLVFTRKIYPTLDPRPERLLVERLRQAIFTDTAQVSAHDTVLISLADKGGLLKNVFDKRELKSRKRRLRSIAEGELCGEAVKAVEDAMRAAVMVAVIMPGVAAGASSGG